MPLPTNAIVQWDGQPLYGVILKAHIADRDHQTEFQMAAPATSDATVPNSTTALRVALKDPGLSVHVNYTPNDGVGRHYRARHILQGSCTGPWSDWVFGGSVLLNAEDPTIDRDEGITDDRSFASEGRRRNDTIYSADERIKNSVRITDTSANFLINRHNESGQAQDGDAVAFASDFESPPQITFVPQIGLTYQAADSTTNQTIELKAENLTVSGFDVRAKITPGSAGTAITDGWSTTQNATDPESGDVTLSADGDVVYCNLEDANTNVTTYTGFYDVAATSMDASKLVTVGLWSNDGAASTTWALRNSQSYDNSASLTDESLGTTLAMGSSWDFRLRTSYSPGAPATSAQATITAHGETHGTEPGMQYVKITGGSPQDMTPNVGDAVGWFGLEAP